ncbi:MULTISPECIES: hypothetical protein [unclassified Streptomyces]|uniref:hypothetical protein n=1 Tax=unclassified Streptomyces TaxID=2593676 RepID=UPI0035E2031B
MADDELYLSQIVGGTSEEQNLAEDYAHLVQQFSSLNSAVEDANWRHAHEKIGALRNAIRDFERRIGRTITEGGERYDMYVDPGVDPHQTLQLITAYAQQYGGRLGPHLFPIEKLDNPAAAAKIRKEQNETRLLREALSAGDAAAASEITGGTVRIVDGMTSDGGR